MENVHSWWYGRIKKLKGKIKKRKMLKNRTDAAMQLAEKLQKYRNMNGVVLAIPRGGVPIAYIIAQTLNMPMDIILSKKIGHPFNKEYAIGAVSLQGEIINRNLPISHEYINEEIQKIRKSLQDKYHSYMGNRKPVDIHNKVVIIVDDGIATGNTLMSTIDLVKSSKPKKIIVAVPVGPLHSIERIEEEVDEVECLDIPSNFVGVGQFYEEFEEVSDETVIRLLNKSHDRELEFNHKKDLFN